MSPKLAKAKLIKRKTEDGFFEVFENVPLGKEYLVDLNTLTEKIK